MPPGLSCQGQPAPAPAARLLLDVTYLDADGQRHSEQEIFDEAMALIRGARRLILADFFLYNEFQGSSRERPSGRMVRAGRAAGAAP